MLHLACPDLRLQQKVGYSRSPRFIQLLCCKLGELGATEPVKIFCRKSSQLLALEDSIPLLTVAIAGRKLKPEK